MSNLLLIIGLVAIAGALLTIVLAVSLGSGQATGVARSLELLERTIDLTGAKLDKANVDGADFRGAVGLDRAQGLDQARNRDKATFDAK